MSTSENVNVCCRFRPVNELETTQKNHRIVVSIGNDCKAITVGASTKKSKSFQFDHVFPPNSSQDAVFNYSALPLVDQVMAGYNCTLFAYGQTGSGKTYTMEGVIDGSPRGGRGGGGGDDTHEGLIPRMVRTIFDRILHGQRVDVEYTLRVSFVEIYNEKLRDLLQPNGAQLKIRDKLQGKSGVYIENVYSPFVGSPEEVFDHLANGRVNRSVAWTRMNDQSSRSHAVFMLQLEARNTETGSSKLSKLMLVDLAGSEKVRKTGATGQRMKEAQQINKSLMVLGLVINSLVENRKHIPYRDSKLTRLLSDALGGNSKTMLIVTASPSKYNQEETVSTLRFGQRAKSIKNEAKINQELSVAEYQKMLEKSKRREDAYKHQIRALQSQNDALIQLCGEHNLDVSKFKAATSSLSSSSNHNPQHPSNSSNSSGAKHAHNSTTALYTLVPAQTTHNAENIRQIEALQTKLEAVSDDRSQLEEILDNKEMEIDELTRETNETHAVMQQMQSDHQQLQNRYEVVWNSQNHREKIHESIKTMYDSLQKRYSVEKLQWGEDKTQLTSDLHSKETSIEELASLRDEYEQRLQQLQQQQRDGDGDGDKLQNLEQEKLILQLQQQVASLSIMNQSDNEDEKDTDNNTAAMAAEIRKYSEHLKRYHAQNKKLNDEQKKLKDKLKVYKHRDTVHKTVRENWSKQMAQMEQAIYLAHDVYNREIARHESAIASKDIEIKRLQKFLLSFTNRHAKSAKIPQHNFPSPQHNEYGAGTAKYLALKQSATDNPNAPGTQKSRIVKPKVIKSGASLNGSHRGGDVHVKKVANGHKS